MILSDPGDGETAYFRVGISQQKGSVWLRQEFILRFGFADKSDDRSEKQGLHYAYYA